MKKTNNINEKSLNLETIRQILGMTQEEFADALGISRRSVVRYENGHREPTFNVSQMKKFVRLVKQAGFELEELPDSLSGDRDRVEGKELVAA